MNQDQNKTTQAQKPIIKNPSEGQAQGLGVLDSIAPQSMEEDFDYIKINDIYFRTLFVAGYPRFVAPGWLEPVVNFDTSLDISFYVYPVDGKSVLDDLRRKIAEMEAEISTDIERGKIVDPSTQAKLEDARSLQEQLVKGIERFYEFSFYITIPANTLDELNHVTRQIESQLGALLIVAKHATLDMEEGFISTAPFGIDKLSLTRNMDTTSVATTFPLTSSELSSDTGVLYGINSQNESFIIFDRFSLENSNMVIFATSGAGKCLSGDTEVLIKDNAGIVKLEKIQNIAAQTFERSRPRKIDNESDGVFLPNTEVYTFNDNLQNNWSRIEIISRKKSPENLYKITTGSGKEIKVTGDHSISVLKNGSLSTVNGKELKAGMYIPTPRYINQNSHKIKDIDAEEILKNSKNNYIIKENRIGTLHGIKNTSLPLKINLTSNFYKIFGCFASEGTVNEKIASVATQNPKFIGLLEKFYKELGIGYYFIKKNGKISAVRTSTKAFSELLIKIGVSGRAGKKRAPQIVFSSSNNMVSSFLKYYFEGDGGTEKHAVSATTKSKGLASDISYLLLRFGVIARIRKTYKAAKNTVDKTKRRYYRIYISGQENLLNFTKNIGFVSQEKNYRLKKLTKRGNTNVDIIPEIGNVFKEISDVLYTTREIPAPRKFSEIKLGIFKPSRENLLSLVKKIEKDIQDFESLEGDGLSTLNSLPSLSEIKERSIDKMTNAKMWGVLRASWQTMKTGSNPPYLANTLSAISVTHGYKYTTEQIGGAIYRSFKGTRESLRFFDKSLWDAVVIGKGNSRYSRILRARDYVSQKYLEKKRQIAEIKKKLNWLKTLATSDLFWDPIVKIAKVKSKHPYVYDLQVKNGVFLAGYGGMFVHNSYFVKLEALRSLMTGTEVIIIDPESEYKPLTEAVGGEYISFAFNAPAKINPFDLAQIREEGENQLGQKILSLHSLLKVIMGAITPTQEALLDRAFILTYRAKGITMDPDTQSKEPPLMEDLYKTLIGMEVPEALDLAARIEKFVRGSFVGIFDKQTNINITNPFTVFSVKDMQDALRPIAMFIILDYIWTRVKKDLKKRLLIAEEAWQMMKYPDTAQFLWSVVKRARKYYLGLTTITQDVEDFLSQDIGKAIVTNSALQVLLKQSPAAIDKIGEIFYLSQGEKQLLLAANVGEGIFFAGPHHAPIRVVASVEEDKLITTKPQEMLTQNK